MLLRCSTSAGATLSQHGHRISTFCRSLRRASTRVQAVQQLQPAEPPLVLRPPPIRPRQRPPPVAKRQGMTPHTRVPPAQQRKPKITLAVVGDVHSQWDADSEAALLSLGADVAVFVGDFGEEAVELIECIAAVPHPKVVMLGNHDAWFSLTTNGRRRYARAMLQSSCLSNRQEYSEGGSTPAIAAQLAALGEDHIGFGSKRFPQLGLTLVGGRPFSKGGKQWSDVADFYEEHYGLGSMQDSAHRILDQALAAEAQDVKVLVAHNGPAGLGSRRHSICGVDWVEPQADFGDPDLQEALDMMAAQGLRVPLVLFGHMHSQLKGRGHRNMVEVDRATGTLYINAAVVPRVRSFPAPAAAVGTVGGGSESGSHGGSSNTIRGHHFLVVELQQQVVSAARDVWVGVQHTAAPVSCPSDNSSSNASRRCVVLHQQELVKTSLAGSAALGDAPTGPGNGGSSGGAAEAAGQQQAAEGPAASQDVDGSSSGEYVCSIYRAHTDEWEPLVVGLPAGAAARSAVAC